MEGEITALALPDEQTFRRNIQAINRFQQIVHATMVKDQDYGVIPGTQKPTLLKPGAEKIAKLLGLADEYELLNQQEDWDKPFFYYLIRCNLRHFGSGTIVSQGLGECNSMENKYRWRDAKRVCPECKQEAIIKGQEQYGGGWLCYAKKGGCGAKWPDGAAEIEGQKLGRVENDDIYSLVNTILKMAKKRALVDAALSAGRLSNIFTQDIEDLEQLRKDDVPHKKPTQTQPEQASEANGAVTERIDMNWLHDSLITLQGKGLKAWSNANIVSYLNTLTKGQSKSVSLAVAALDASQAQQFVKRVNDALAMA